jgi:Protein of unknown function (DUF1638)
MPSPRNSPRSMRLKLISCDLFQREVQAAAARSSNNIEAEFLREAPHHLNPAEIVRSFQSLIDQALRPRYHAVLMAVGSCQPGLSGVRANSIPLVLPRAKDCISLVIERASPSVLPGMRSERAQRLPGVAKPSEGRSSRTWSAPPVSPGLMQVNTLFQRADRPLLEDSLAESWRWRLGADACPGAAGCPVRARRQQLSILEKLLEGYWNYRDFLVVPPGWQIVADPGQGTIMAEESPL